MNDEILHVLVVEDNPETAEFLEEAFLEMEDRRFGRPWIKACQRDLARDIGKALRLLRERPYDAILLDLAIPGDRESSLFDILRGEAPLVPIVVLAEPADEPMAIGLVRRGAQDYLLLPELDCLPLARAIRKAIDRSRCQDALWRADGSRADNRREHIA
jgi:CheY-like chemotaxis protein